MPDAAHDATQISTRLPQFLFQYEAHQTQLVLFWRSQEERFVAFLNMIINDLYTLDHGFDGLTETDSSRASRTQRTHLENSWKILFLENSACARGAARVRALI